MSRMIDLRGLQPSTVRDTLEFQALAETEEVEFSALLSAQETVFGNQFVDTLDAAGCLRWEGMLGIRCRLSDTLPMRRAHIKACLNEELPYTMRVLLRALVALCGEDGFAVHLYGGEYRLVIELELTEKRMMDEVRGLLARMVPANLVVEVVLKYRKWQDVQGYTWQNVAAFTWDELREGVLDYE